MTKIYLKKDKEKLPLNKHSWVFSGAIGKVEGKAESGDIVAVFSAEYRFIAWASYNPDSKIMLRLMEWDQNREINLDWYKEKLAAAFNLRAKLIDKTKTDICRMLYADADFLPGLIIDRFGDYLVFQSSSPSIDKIKLELCSTIRELLPEITGIYEKSEGDGRRLEGLKESKGWLWGGNGELIRAMENGLKFEIDIASQKTGFYADQRENRLAVRRYAEGKKVLDVCCFTGGFSANALAAGALSVTLCDSSAAAIEQSQKNLALNRFGSDNITCQVADAFEFLRTERQQGRRYDVIVLDPPKLMPGRRDMDKAIRAYKDLNLQALKLLEPQGILITFSCSGNMSAEMFKETVAYAAKDAGVNLQIIEQLHQGFDHPVRSSVPETEYLKGLVCRLN